MIGKKKRKGTTVQQKSVRPGRVTYITAEEAFPDNGTKEKKRNLKRGFKTFGITVAMVAAAAGCAYSAVAYYYTHHFFPGTSINGIDSSNMTAYEVEQAIAASMEGYSIEVNTRNLAAQTITGTSISYQYVSDGTVLKLLKSQSPFAWAAHLQDETSYTITTDATYDKALLEEQVKSLEANKEENQYPATDAYVSYQNDTFTIIPETEGTEISIKNAYNALDDAISEASTEVDLGSIPDVYETAEVTADSQELQETLSAYNNMANASITYQFGEAAVTLDAATIRSWLQFDERGQLLQNDGTFQQKVAEYVSSLAASYNTVGTERPFDTTSGRTVYVSGSAYGWQIDQEAETAQLMADIQSGAVITREPAYSKTANSHGYNDFGNTYIEVDLSQQYLYYYRDGVIILETPIVSGLMSDPSRQTPSGVYTLYYKKSPDVLRGAQLEDGTYEYEADVSFWMPFNGGVGFHDATWQAYFGGDRYLYAGSHGCINLPYYAAASLYELIDYNVPIICFY